MKYIWNFYDENMKKSGASQGQSASELISKRIAELGDWRGETLSRIRKLIKEADPDVVEEWKWMGTPIWSHDGIISTGESYKNVVKLTSSKGASLKDPARLFNSSLDGNARRAIDIHEGEEVVCFCSFIVDFLGKLLLIRPGGLVGDTTKNCFAPTFSFGRRYS
ncbi:MAG: DUF1801 domain-containing protein [Isosphaeraceae bacterium]